MAIPSVIVTRELVPDGRPEAPEGFTLVRQSILGGLPHAVALDRERTLLLTVPTGLAKTWLDADPLAVVSRSAEAYAPHAQGGAEIGDVARAPARLVLRRGGSLAGSVALVAGLRGEVACALGGGVHDSLRMAFQAASALV